MKKYLALCLCALLALASCTQELAGDLTAREQARQALTGQTVTLDAYDADAALATKTSRADDGSVLWSPGDKISLFYGSGSDGGCEFTSNNQEPAGRVQFTGEINVITGLSEGTEDIMFWGVYPYSWNNSCNGSTVTMWLNDCQRAADNTWTDGVFPAVGHSSGLAMGFYNLCGGLIFYVTEDGITRIDFRGKNDEVLAGPVTVAFNDGVPAITSFQDTLKEIFLMAPSSYGTTAAYDTFKKTTPGDTTWYFMILPPMTFSQGHTVTFHKNDGTYGVREFGTRTVTRNKFTRIRSAALNNGVEFQPLPLDNNQIRYTATEKIDYYIPQTSTTGNVVVSNTWDSVTGLGIITFADAITKLDNYAFADMNALISITLPYGLEEIAPYSFEGCNNLTTVNIPNSVDDIGRLAFGHCTSLESIHIPRLNGIGIPNPFAGCTNLKEFSGPHASADGKFLGFHFDNPARGYLASCALGAFKNQELVLPEVATIGDQACYEGEFTQAIIPGTVTEIGESAFEGCTKLNTIILKHGSYEGVGSEGFVWPAMPTLGEKAFTTGGTTLCTIKVPGAFVTPNNAGVYVSSSPWYGYRDQVVVYQADNEIWYSDETPTAGLDNSMLFQTLYTADGTELDHYMQKGVFYQKEKCDPNDGLASEPAVSYPSTYSGKPLVVEVYSGDIASIANPSSILYQESYISLPHSVETIGNEAFKDNTALLAFPSDGELLVSIGKKAFMGCTAMAGEVNVPNLVKLENAAFSGCTAITGVTLGGGVDLVQPEVFKNCSSLQWVLFPSGLPVAIGDGAFKNCSALKSVGDSKTFQGLRAAAELIRTGAFAGCINLRKVQTLATTIVATGAFDSCTGLTTVKLGGPVQEIQKYAFHACTNLTSVDLSDTQSLTTIGNYAFAYCPKLKYVRSSTETVNGVILPKVTSVGEGAFIGSGSTEYGGFDYVTIGNGVDDGVTVSLQDSVFANCTALNTINLPNTTALPTKCFMNCTNLHYVHVEKATLVQEQAFSGCTGLPELILPAVTTIGDRAFAFTYNLATLKLGANLATLGKEIFYDNAVTTLPVNMNKMDIYFYGTAWFTNQIYNAFRYNIEGNNLDFLFKNVYLPSSIANDFEDIVNNGNAYVTSTDYVHFISGTL